MNGWVQVRVPASTSNLGAGFDCVGAAVDRWLDARATLDPRAGGFVLDRAGTLAGLTANPADDRLVRGFVAACATAGRAAPDGVRFDVRSEIPVARGLGSSAAATVAGAAAANALLELGLDSVALAAACAGVEGHADNVSAAVWGGARLVLLGGARGLVSAPMQLHPSIALVFGVPDFPVETSAARRALPASLPHAVATRAAALAAALVQGLATADRVLLEAALDDVLHVPFRRALVRGYDAVTRAACDAGAFGATLSGSGPTIVAVAPAGASRGVADALRTAWRGEGVHAECLVNPPAVRGYTLTDARTAPHNGCTVPPLPEPTEPTPHRRTTRR